MIYLDSSVALAHILREPRSPHQRLWSLPVVSSRLLAYEVWNCLHAAGLGEPHATVAAAVLARISLVDMTQQTLERALRPFPVPVRTLDGLHLASMLFLKTQGESIELASYDRRLNAAAEALSLRLLAL